ncbi:MAG: sugar porter family MFS transporter [Bacteroidales bacterium]|nr:sugar porter family MFS transporter [Candidatus Cryptobacteroides choladohippi]MCQ2179484.1 sugar porter family MFS transporter [Bacteroidales bacterium]
MKDKENNLRYVLFLSFVAALGGILFGYDTAVISGTTADVSTQFGLSEMSKGWYVGCALVGSIIGVAFAGMMSDFLGRKLTMLVASILFSVSAIGCCLCDCFPTLVVYRIIGGLGIGIVSIVSPIYISEVSPARIRGTMVTLYQLAITVGLLLAYLVNYVICSTAPDTVSTGFFGWAFRDEMWRGMLGSETIVTLLFFVTVLTIPESPKWLIVKGKDDKAMTIFSRLKNTAQGAQDEFLATKASIAGEVKSEWRALLEPGIMKAVMIGCAIAILGQFMGVNAVLYYGPEIFADAGLAAEDSLLSTVLVGLVNMLTTVLAVFIIDKVGRKKLIWFGVTSMIICLVTIGVIFATGAGGLLLLVFFLLYIFSQAISISAVVFVLLSEMYPNRVRGLAMSIAGLALWFGTYLIGQFTPWCLSTLSPAGTFWFFALMCLPYMLIMWKLVPETTGKTLEEIENFWK